METRTIDGYGCININNQRIYLGGEYTYQKVECLENDSYRLIQPGKIIQPKQQPIRTIHDEVSDEACK